MTKQNLMRNHGMDVLRVLACYMVIQVHAGEFYYIGQDSTILAGDGPFWVNWYNSLCRTAVPLFVMISGYFLLPVKDDLKTFFSKRFTRVLIPFVVWCALYAFYFFFRGQGELSDIFINILKIPVNFGVEVGHLWYIYMLIGLYLFAPIISPWLNTASRRGIELYLGIWIVSLCLPYIHLIFPEVLGECFWNKTPLLYYFSGFLGFMILAFYLRKYMSQPQKWHLPVSILLIIVGYAITAGGFAINLKTATLVPELERTWLFESINVAMMSLGLFMLCLNINFSNPSSIVTRIITDISKMSYGMYLVHIMALNFFYDIFDSMITQTSIKLPLIAICCFLLSYLIIKLLSYLPKSKYIIG